jgi:outer membrane protein
MLFFTRSDKNMKRIIGGIFVFMLVHVAFAQDTLTVEQAVQQVLTNHPAVQQAEENVRASVAKVGQEKSTELPNASLEALYTRLEPVPDIYFPGLGDFKLYPENNYDAHVGGEYTVFDFGKTNARVDVGESHVQEARDMVILAKTRLAYQTVQVFYSILFLQKSIGVANEQIDALNQHLLVTEKKVTSGTATSFEVLTTQVRTAAAENRKVELQDELQKQQTVLKQLLGASLKTQINLQGEFTMTPVSLDEDSLVQEAMAQRTEMAITRDNEKSAELQYRLASKGNMPSLNVNLTYGVKNGFIPDLDVLRGNWVAGMQMTVPLFEGNRVEYQEEEANADLLAARSRTNEIERQVRAEVEQAIEDVKTAISKIQISDLQVQQAQQAVVLARSRYESGSATNLDVLDAETAESDAKLGNLQALLTYVLGTFELNRAVGSMPF